MFRDYSYEIAQKLKFLFKQGDCLNAIGKQFHPECFKCTYCGKQFGNSPFFLEEGDPYCETDWNELFTTKCFACGFPVEAGDKWVEALNNNYHSQCFNCTVSIDAFILSILCKILEVGSIAGNSLAQC